MPKTILVADDSVTIRKVVELAFQDTEIRVESVGSGGDALARMEAIHPDLVLADVVMPAPDGYEVCRAVKASGRPVPVLLLSGSFEPFDPQRARDCGADGHVQKPFESRALLQRVRELVDRPAATPAPAPAAAAKPSLDPVSIDDVLDDLAGLRPAEPAAVAEPTASRKTGRGAMDILLGEPEPPPLPTSPVPAVPAPPIHRAAGVQLTGLRLGSEDLDALVQAVVARLSDRVIREVAWEVVPELAENLVRERIRELERSDSDPVS